ncbi:MAG TPA: dihydropteroate synthase [Bradyrhizobium sp.]|nr:dihydropteroate synthase [Bradyrhizobium sp.]HWZ72585.1 dihydropteroate synthase [Casimicrobiaceae bacterium]
MGPAEGPGHGRRRCRRRGGSGYHAQSSRKGTSVDILDIRQFFARSLALAEKAGNAPSRIILDLGIAFAKSARQNAEVIARLPSCRIWAVRSSSVRPERRFLVR